MRSGERRPRYTYNFTAGKIRTFTVPFRGQTTVAYGINDLGEIVGGYCQGPSACPSGLAGNSPTHGYLFSNNAYITLDYPDPLVIGTSCKAINNAGTIVGWYETDHTENGFIYHNGTYSLLDFLGAMATFPSAINNSGVVAGTFQDANVKAHGFTYRNGIFTQVDVPPPPAIVTGVSGINDAGVLVGSYLISVSLLKTSELRRKAGHHETNMSRPRMVWVFAVLAVLCTAGLAVEAAQHYTFSTAGNVPLPFTTATPIAVSLTHIVGYYITPSASNAYIQTGSLFITPAPKTATSSYLSGINRHGVAVGGYCTNGGCAQLNADRGYIYNFTTGKIRTFTVSFKGQTTIAYGINDFGDIVGGYCQGPSGCPPGVVQAPTHGFLFSRNTYTTLDYPDPLVTGTQCNAINDAGTIVGWYETDHTENGFIYHNGTYSLLDFPGAMATFPSAINNSGVVAGTFQDANVNAHGFTYQNGTFTQVDVPPQQAIVTGVSGINDDGVLVGVYVNYKQSLG
jgi:probable HAF family extracellular repeat protein